MNYYNHNYVWLVNNGMYNNRKGCHNNVHSMLSTLFLVQVRLFM